MVTRGYDLGSRFSTRVLELEQVGLGPREVTIRPLPVLAPEGPPISDGVLTLPSSEPDPSAAHITRGGAGSLPAWVSRAAVRGYHPPIRLADLGLRLCRSYGG